jgi:hypothetical protein
MSPNKKTWVTTTLHNAEYDIALVRNAIMSLLEGPDCLRGYCLIWHALQMNGMSSKIGRGNVTP